MHESEIQRAEKGIGYFLKFLNLFSKYDDYRLEARLDAVEAIGKAAAETRAWTKELRQRSDGQEVTDRGPEISLLWAAAARKIAKFDPELSAECMVKAYGWRTGKWNNPEYQLIPRRVEEVHAQALALIKEYQPILGKSTR